jgi:hypothetical protein
MASARYSTQAATRRRPKARFYLILGAVLAVVVMVVALVLHAQATSLVEMGQTSFSATYDMLIIRSEVVYEAKNYGKTVFIAEEGQHVSAGDPIAQVYSWEYNDDTYSQLLSLQQQILDYEVTVSRAGVIDPQLDDVNSRISAKVAEVEAAVKEDRPQDALTLQRELEALMTERAEYLKSVVMVDDTLRGYYSDEAALEATISGWRMDLTANAEGVVSFYFDGNEALMTPANIGSFTEKALSEVAAGKTIKTGEGDAAYAPLYRIVDTDDWYVVMYSADAIPEMHEGSPYSLVFDEYIDHQYTGVVCNATTLANNGGFVYTIRIQEDIGPLVGDRRVTARLVGEQQGWRVKKSCVQETRSETENGQTVTVTYVETADGQYVQVEIIADDGNYYLVRTVEGQGTLTEGQRIRG